MFKKLLPILLLTGCLDSPYESQVAIATTTKEETIAPPTKIDSQLTTDSKAMRPESLASMFRSDDLGRTWTPVGEGLPENVMITQLEKMGNQILIGTFHHGVFLSHPGNERWQQLDTTSLPSNHITSLHVAGSVIYAGVLKHGIFASTDQGKSWASLNHNLQYERVKSILRTDNELWIGTDRGIFSLKNGTETWQQTTTKPLMSGLLKVGDNLVAGTYEGIALSSDNGKTWNIVNRKIKPSKVTFVNGKIIAMDTEEGMEVSEDLGKTWKSQQRGIVHENHVYEVTQAGDGLLRSQPDGLYLSKDGGNQWKDIYHFSFDEPFGVMLSVGEQWNEVYSRPEAPFVELIVVDGVVFGATVRGC